MILYVYFLLGDGLKSYFEWINDVLRSKHRKNYVKKTWFLTRSVWKFRNQYSFDQKCMEISKSRFAYQKCHLFFAAGAFWQNKCSKKHEDYEKFLKIMKIMLNMSSILCRRRLFTKKIMKKTWKIIENTENMENHA